jgi:uncharacterized protein Veg
MAKSNSNTHKLKTIKHKIETSRGNKDKMNGNAGKTNLNHEIGIIGNEKFL